MISVLIPTKNEEQDLPGCLESVRWSDDITVYDSGSTDRTIEIAKGSGARIVCRPSADGAGLFGGDEAEHKNWALANIDYKYDWVLHVDADERPSPELVANMRRIVQHPSEIVGFEVQRRDFFLETWLKHVQATSFYIRLFRPHFMRFERVINPISVMSGPIGRVDGYLDHFPFNKGMQRWLDRHNAYSTLEARQILTNRAAGKSFSIVQAVFGKDYSGRRAHQKEAFYRMPARPLVKFLWLYIAKRGFLDGKAGFTYAVLQSFYEYMIVLKMREFAQIGSIEPQTDSGMGTND
jgi:glycosyltransferase involved in cell wall biosynthesis